MPLTTAEVVARTFYRLPGISQSESGLYRFRIESWIPDALKRLADEVMSGRMPVEPNYFNKLFSSIALTAGIAALASTINIASIPLWGLVTGTGLDFPLQYVPSLYDLDLPKSNLFEYYTINGTITSGGAIHVRKGDGTATELTSVNIRCGFYPALSEVPDQLSDNFIDMMVMLGREKLGVSPTVGVGANQNV